MDKEETPDYREVLTREEYGKKVRKGAINGLGILVLLFILGLLTFHILGIFGPII